MTSTSAVGSSYHAHYLISTMELPLSGEDQAGRAKAIADLVDRMLAMPDEEPPGAWEDAIRELDAQRPHRKHFEGLDYS